MTLIIPPGFAQVVYRVALVGDPEDMVFTVGLDHDAAGDFVGLAEDLYNEFTSAFSAAEINNQYSFKGVKLYVGQDPGPPAIYEWELNHQGTYAGAGAMPQNCAFLIKKKTAVGGRAHRGRMYLPPFGVDELSVGPTGVIGAAAYGLLATNIAAWLDAPSRNWVILHDSTSPATTPTPITQFVLDDTVATQRRRLRR